MSGRSKKIILHSEVAYVLGLFILAIGTAMMERADFGVSMVVAPAYLLHLKLSVVLPWFSFGVAEYCMQAVLLIILGIVMRRFKITYLFSFLTAVFYGILLDCSMALIALIPGGSADGGDLVSLRVLLYILGLVLCAVGISLLFHTYVIPEAYELFVKEVSAKFGTDINRTKTVYDCVSCVVAIIMSFLFFGFGHFEGVKVGTVICALVNGTLIGFISRINDRIFEYRDLFRRSQK